MRLSDIAGAAVGQLVGRAIRRALGFAIAGLLAIVMLYYASAAGSTVLIAHYGMLNAYLIMAGIYAAATAIVLIVLFATRNKPKPAAQKMTGALASGGGMQIAMLVEAVMLGYTLARKSGKPLI